MYVRKCNNCENFDSEESYEKYIHPCSHCDIGNPGWNGSEKTMCSNCKHKNKEKGLLCQYWRCCNGYPLKWEAKDTGAAELVCRKHIGCVVHVERVEYGCPVCNLLKKCEDLKKELMSDAKVFLKKSELVVGETYILDKGRVFEQTCIYLGDYDSCNCYVRKIRSNGTLDNKMVLSFLRWTFSPTGE